MNKMMNSRARDVRRLRPIQERGSNVKVTTQRAAAAMGLVPLTCWDSPRAVVPTIRGDVNYYTWCQWEVERMRQVFQNLYEPPTILIATRKGMKGREIAIYSSYYLGGE